MLIYINCVLTLITLYNKVHVTYSNYTVILINIECEIVLLYCVKKPFRGSHLRSSLQFLPQLEEEVEKDCWTPHARPRHAS